MRLREILTDGEWEHLLCSTKAELWDDKARLASFVRNRRAQLAMPKVAFVEPCWECKFIARKLIEAGVLTDADLTDEEKTDG